MGEYEQPQPDVPVDEPDALEEEGQKYDGGEIPRHVPTEQEDEN